MVIFLILTGFNDFLADESSQKYGCRWREVVILRGHIFLLEKSNWVR